MYSFLQIHANLQSECTYFSTIMQTFSRSVLIRTLVQTFSLGVHTSANSCKVSVRVYSLLHIDVDILREPVDAVLY